MFSKDKKIILDVDTGIDDALAIILLSKTLGSQIIGITTCGGNVGVTQTTKNTLAILELLGSDVSVYKGSAKPLSSKQFVEAFDYHGNDGLCNVDLPVTRSQEAKDAVDFIVESSKKYGDNLVIISVAPPTNIAKAFIKYPEIAKQISQLYLMGGAINVPGNSTKYAEFNFFQDPLSVKMIFDNFREVNLIPLDVTHKCLIDIKDLTNIKSKSCSGKFIIKAIKNWYAFFGNPNNRQFELYDPLAVSAILGDFLNFKNGNFTIETEGDKAGSVVPGRNMINYAEAVKSQEFMDFFYKIINL